MTGMNTGDMVIFWMGIGGLSLLIFWLIFGKGFGSRRKLGGLPKALVDELSETEAARVVGRVDPSGALLRAPGTGRPCVAWWLIVSRTGPSWGSAAGQPRAVEKIFERIEHRSFRVIDREGDALEIPEECPIALDLDRTQVFGVSMNRHPDVVELLRENGIEGSSNDCWFEAALEPGALVCVGCRATGLGTLEADAGESDHVRVAQPMKDGAVIVTDAKSLVK